MKLKEIKKTTTVKRELSQASLDAFQIKHSYVQPGYRLCADIPMKIMFENTPSVHLTVYRGIFDTIGDSLDSLNMLRMRSGLHLFDYIWLYI